MHRIFIAIKLSEELAQDVLAWQKEYIDALLGTRWVEQENLHITLVAPWQVNDLELGNAVAQLQHVEFEPFDIEFNKISFGQNVKAPRLVWATGEANSEIQDLKSKIESSVGFRPESRPFKPHITLAKFRQEDFQYFDTKELNDEISWKQRVESFVIMESHIGPDGTDYEVLGEIEGGGVVEDGSDGDLSDIDVDND